MPAMSMAPVKATLSVDEYLSGEQTSDVRHEYDNGEEKPTLIIEVLSPSTETRDELEKLASYTRIPTLKEYFTVAQDRVEVQRYTIDNGDVVVTSEKDNRQAPRGRKERVISG